MQLPGSLQKQAKNLLNSLYSDTIKRLGIHPTSSFVVSCISGSFLVGLSPRQNPFFCCEIICYVFWTLFTGNKTIDSFFSVPANEE